MFQWAQPYLMGSLRTTCNRTVTKEERFDIQEKAKTKTKEGDDTYIQKHDC